MQGKRNVVVIHNHRVLSVEVSVTFALDVDMFMSCHETS